MILPPDQLTERGMPANPDAERSVLGAILLDNSAYNLSAAIVTSSDFSVDAHRRIYQQIVGLREGTPARPVDFTTLTEELLRAKELDVVGGVTFLSSLTDGLPRAVNAEHYAKIVKDKSTRRRLIHTCHAIVEEGLDPSGETSELLDRAESAVLEIGQAQVRGGLSSVLEIAPAAYAALERGRSVTGIETGFRQFDDLTRGFRPGDFDIIAARPSMGKTAWAMNVAQNVAIKGNTVAVFSLEMTKEALLQRMMCSEGRVDSHKFRAGYLSKEDLRDLGDAMARLEPAPLYIDDTAGITLYELRAKARRLKAEKGLALIIIDYLQLMATPRAENRNQEISILSRGLKSLAKELHVPVVALSQLSRAPETRGGDQMPQLSDLRDSGSLEQDADLVAFIHRKEYYERMKGHEIPEDIKGRANIIIAKQRNGPTDKVPLLFIDRYASFANPE